MKYNKLDKKLIDISLKYLAKDFERHLEEWLEERGGSFTWNEMCQEFFVFKKTT